MAGSVGTDSSGSVNVELNVVPFIDLMSCLTAFLLVTAVWSSYAQIPIDPKGINRDGRIDVSEVPTLTLSVLLTENEIWLGLDTGDRRQIASASGAYDWAALERALREYRAMDAIEARPVPGAIEIAAEDQVTYQHVVSAMDYAIASRFPNIGYTDPGSLTVRFRE